MTYSLVVIVRDGAKLSAIGEAIEKRAAESNCTVVPYFCGHGIGTYFHGPPNVLHFGKQIFKQFLINNCICISSPSVQIFKYSMRV